MDRELEPPPGPEARPTLDEAGLLRYDGRWIAIPDAQLPVVRLLLANAGRVVRTEEIADAYASAGGSPRSGSVRAVTFRLGKRLRAVGLRLHTVRNRGILLEVPGASDHAAVPGP
ncbi:MAG: helix-turn-helix domain-containing protein [Acidimicrobiia bacterium]